jgi:hypothetical protein
MSLNLCCLFSTILGLIVPYVVYMIYGIHYLVKYYHLNAECPDSHLWVYILVSLIVSTSRTSIVKISEASTPAILAYLICLFMIDGSFTIWGEYELFSTSCKPMISSELWVFGFITFVIQVVMVSIYVLLCCCSIAITCYDSYSHKEYITFNGNTGRSEEGTWGPRGV